MFEDMTNALVLSEKKIPLQKYFSEMHHQETLLSSLDFTQRVIIVNLNQTFNKTFLQ